MIENPYPNSWKDLQSCVCRLFRDIGLTAETEKILETPRGTAEIDVYAVDEKSVDQIKYLVECKNWESAIPQTVVHSFTTVMHEVGANIGFIVSQKGLQSGALAYTQNTNIIGLTYEEFQFRYFQVWYKRYFIPQIGNAVDSLAQYVEPINSYRDRQINALSDDKKSSFILLSKRYQNLGMFMAFLLVAPEHPLLLGISPYPSIDELKNSFRKELGDEFNFSSIYYRDLLAEILSKIMSITNQYNEIFGRDIFLGREYFFQL